jgi:hypothetical protein
MLLKYECAKISSSDKRKDFTEYLRPIFSTGVLLFSLVPPSTVGRDSVVGINKCQDNKLKNCCIKLVIYLN